MDFREEMISEIKKTQRDLVKRFKQINKIIELHLIKEITTEITTIIIEIHIEI